MLAAPLRPCKADMHVDIVEIPSIPRSVPTGAPGRGSSSQVHPMAPATTRSGHPARVRWVEVFERKEAAWTATRWRATSTSSSDRSRTPSRSASGTGSRPGDDRPDGELGPRARGARDGRRGRLRGLGRRGRRRGRLTTDLPRLNGRRGRSRPPPPSRREPTNAYRVRPAVARAPGPLRPREPTGRARGLERRASRSRRHRWTRTRHPRSHRTRGPADRRRRGRTPGAGS